MSKSSPIWAPKPTDTLFFYLFTGEVLFCQVFKVFICSCKCICLKLWHFNVKFNVHQQAETHSPESTWLFSIPHLV